MSILTYQAIQLRRRWPILAITGARFICKRRQLAVSRPRHAVRVYLTAALTTAYLQSWPTETREAGRSGARLFPYGLSFIRGRQCLYALSAGGGTVSDTDHCDAGGQARQGRHHRHET